MYKIGQRVLVQDTDGAVIWLSGTVHSITHRGLVRVMVDCSGILDLDPKDRSQIKPLRGKRKNG